MSGMFRSLVVDSAFAVGAERFGRLSFKTLEGVIE